MRGRLGLRILAAALVGLVLAGPLDRADAQGRERLEEELRRTDELLERAAEVVRQSDSVRARDVLEQAFRIQREARGHFHGGRFLLAGRLTLEAREVGGRAIQLAREDATVRERTHREIERATRELGRAHELVGERPTPEAVRLLEEATRLLDRARAALAEQQFLAALRLSVASQRLAGQAVALAGGDPARRLTRDLERTDHLLERIGPLVEASGDAGVLRQFEAARGLQRGAWEAFHGRRPREAGARTRDARALANRVRAALGAADDRGAIGTALEETARILARAAEVIGPTGEGPANTLLQRAVDHQARARAAFESGDVRRALAQTRVARNLARRALHMVGDGET